MYEKLGKKPPLEEKYKLLGIGKNTTVDAWKVTGLKISFDDTPGHRWNVLVASIQEQLIIGVDFMCHFRCVLDFHNYSFVLNKVNRDLTEFKTKDGESFEQHEVRLLHSITVPSRKMMRTLADTQPLPSESMIVVSSLGNKDLIVPNVLVKAAKN